METGHTPRASFDPTGGSWGAPKVPTARLQERLQDACGHNEMSQSCEKVPAPAITSLGSRVCTG